MLQELQIAGINFKAFDLGGHEIARRVWKDYYAKVGLATSCGFPNQHAQPTFLNCTHSSS